MVLNVKSSIRLWQKLSGKDLMGHMVLFLEVLKGNSYGSQGQIMLMAVASVLRDESNGAYGSLPKGSQSQILWFSKSNVACGCNFSYEG